jgi:hypothetical protein
MFTLMRRLFTGVLIGLVIGLSLAACSGAQSDSPAAAVETYLKTRITGDEARLVALVCKDREGDARTEAASFSSMKANIEGLSCKQSGTDGQFTIVACAGKMTTVYAGETRNIDLAARAFKAIQEDGKWKVCGMQ